MQAPIELPSWSGQQGRRSGTYFIKLGSGEMTKSLRGLPVRMDWDASEKYSDIVVDGEFLVRVSVPQS
ncbi:MAG: hypothetical protein R3C56_23655 [Pirellulaceae bacterium]